MSSDRLTQSQLPGGAHHLLASLAGEWEGPTSTWFEPDELADESMWRGTMRLILGGRFVLHEYTGSIQGEPFQGIAWYGYNLTTNAWEAAWIDTAHMGTAMMFSSGPPATSPFSVLGSYDVLQGGPPWGWRTTIELIDADHVTITAYNITPEGQEAKGIETRYTRLSS